MYNKKSIKETEKNKLRETHSVCVVIFHALDGIATREDLVVIFVLDILVPALAARDRDPFVFVVIYEQIEILLTKLKII